MNKVPFGVTKAGEAASLYTIKNSRGMSLTVTDYGVTIVSIFVKDKKGELRDVILGYDRVEDYDSQACYFGAIIGRNCNRIADCRVEIDGVTYELENNDSGNNLHSGSNCLGRKIWTVKEQTESKIVFTYDSPAMDQGFPGNVKLEATVEVTEDNDFLISYYAVSDAKTVLNMTNHNYYNLSGHASGDILGQTLQINAERYTPVKDSHAIPTGELAPVEGTPFDFRVAKPIGQDIRADFDQLRYGGGYDHNFVLARTTDGMEKVATAYSPESGIFMEVYTDCVAMQLYTANGIAGQIGKGGVQYPNNGAFCLETQYCPNAVNEPNFATPVFDAGVPYKSTTYYHFGVN